jgi:RNA polymerase sigma-70 factor (ECF subfamily)
VRVEEHHAEDDREGEEGHAASVRPSAPSGQVLNAAPRSGTRAVVNAASAIDVVARAPGAPTRPHPRGETREARDGLDHHALVRRAAAGESSAFRELFERHRGDVARLVWRMLGAPSDLDDVVQEVFVQVFRSLKDFREQAKFTTWLHRVTVNVVLMHRRSARSRPVLTEEAPGELVADDGQPLPDEDAERRERMRAFQRLLDRLADKKRIVFVLHELEGMSPAEIADVVDAPVLTVRTRLFYARRELEAMLADEPALSSLTASFRRKEDA